MFNKIVINFISRAEKRLGVRLDYTRQIAKTDFELLMRYNKVFGFLDPNKNVPAMAYHAARLVGALSADCGTCVQAEINLAKEAGISPYDIEHILRFEPAELPDEIAAVLRLSKAVTAQREDDSQSRDIIRAAYGEAGLIEISYAMNGAALLPGIKRAMGYATSCDLAIMKISNS